MDRRVALAMCAAPALVAGCAAAEVSTFPTLAAAMKAAEALATGHTLASPWSLAMMLGHAAQSVEYSMRGFPQPKSALFRHTVGPAAFAVFEARGRMSHALDEPIPGAPALAADAPLPAAIERLTAALRAFEAHAGALAPHFAYGALDKAQYTRAHLMHLANHWEQVRRT